MTAEEDKFEWSYTVYCYETSYFQVYYDLLKVYLDPPEPSVLGLPAYRNDAKPKPDIEKALKIMEKYAGCIDTVKVGVSKFKYVRVWKY